MVFRADASVNSGSGHVMRISVLAEEAVARGYECIFIGKIEGLDWVRTRIWGLGFIQIYEDESSFSSDSISDILVLDSYFLSIDSKFLDQANWRMILVIKDSKTPNYRASIQLLPLLNAPTVQLSEDSLTGPDYILIRKGIEKNNREIHLSRKPSILVVGGGSDPNGFVKAIATVFQNMEITNQIHYFSSEELILSRGRNCFVHSPGPQLDEISLQVDLVLTTASTSCLEFIAQEIPAGIACAIDNQVETYEHLGSLGLAKQIGYFNSQGEWIFDLAEMKSLVSGGKTLQNLRNRVQGLIDFKGASRVLDKIELFVSKE